MTKLDNNGDAREQGTENPESPPVNRPPDDMEPIDKIEEFLKKLSVDEKERALSRILGLAKDERPTNDKLKNQLGERVPDNDKERILHELFDRPALLFSNFRNGTSPVWDMSQERAFVENLLNTRFNFFLVVFVGTVAAAGNAKDNVRLVLTLAAGAIITFFLSLVLCRTQKKLDLILRGIFSDDKSHPATIVNEKAGEGRFRSKRQLIGYYIPWGCFAILLVGTFAAWCGCLKANIDGPVAKHSIPTMIPIPIINPSFVPISDTSGQASQLHSTPTAPSISNGSSPGSSTAKESKAPESAASASSAASPGPSSTVRSSPRTGPRTGASATPAPSSSFVAPRQ